MASIDRRDFVKKVAVGSIAVASLPSLAGALTGPVRADGDGDDNGHDRGWWFTAVSRVGETADFLILTGCGSFSDDDVDGGGTFLHFTGGTGPPADIVATGTWKARKLLSFSEVGQYGQLISGVLDADVRLRPVGGPRVRATLKIVCNIGPAGLNTGMPEGYFLTVGDVTFSPIVGNTLFTKRPPSD